MAMTSSDDGRNIPAIARPLAPKALGNFSPLQKCSNAAQNLQNAAEVQYKFKSIFILKVYPYVNTLTSPPDNYSPSSSLHNGWAPLRLQQYLYQSCQTECTETSRCRWRANQLAQRNFEAAWQIGQPGGRRYGGTVG